MKSTVSRSKPPFHKQETPHSRVPAFLHTVLVGFGLDVSESELRTLCDTTIFGTAALKTVDAARALGFTGTAKHKLSHLDDKNLRSLIGCNL